MDFLRGIATALHHADPDLELHVLVPMHGPIHAALSFRESVKNILGGTDTAKHHPDPAHLVRAIAGTRAILHKIDHGQLALRQATKRLQLDVLLPAITPSPKAKVPWIGYIFDFQHKQLPQFFSVDECLKRDREFGLMLSEADAVIVNAQDVINHINTYYPTHRARVFALPFSPAPPGEAFSVNIEEACQRYGVKGPYFIVCNQFWKHKDHMTAFKAFAIAAARNPKLSLVCTGSTSDHRFPEYFDELMAQASRDGLEKRIQVLGLIPKLDQLALLRGAVALVQPTLFEGGPGGGAVYDAVAVGQRCLVSNIPVNMEINEPEVSFFEAGNPLSLAERMETELTRLKATHIDGGDLIGRGIQRRRACGMVLLEAIEYVRMTQTKRCVN